MKTETAVIRSVCRRGFPPSDFGEGLQAAARFLELASSLAFPLPHTHKCNLWGKVTENFLGDMKGVRVKPLAEEMNAVTAPWSPRAGVDFIGFMAMVEREEGDGIAFPVGKCDTTNGS